MHECNKSPHVVCRVILALVHECCINHVNAVHAIHHEKYTHFALQRQVYTALFGHYIDRHSSIRCTQIKQISLLCEMSNKNSLSLLKSTTRCPKSSISRLHRCSTEKRERTLFVLPLTARTYMRTTTSLLSAEECLLVTHHA